MCNNKSDKIGHTLQCCYIYLEYVGDNCKVMVILLLVELLQVGGVFTLTVSGHLVPHLRLLSCLKKNNTHKHAYQRHSLQCSLINTDIWLTHTHSQIKTYMS